MKLGQSDNFAHHWKRVLKHYNHVLEKHPYFADKLICDGWSLKSVQENLAHLRGYIKRDIERGNVEALSLAHCELREFEVAMVRGDKAAAVEECYDAIAVLMRVVDVLEGRQQLGKPEVGVK